MISGDTPPALAWRSGLTRRWLALLGDFPRTIPTLQPEIHAIDPISGVPAFRISFNAEDGDRVTAYLLVPPKAHDSSGLFPAVICPHSTTEGAGKDRIAGLSGTASGSPPDEFEDSRAYGLWFAMRGYITLSIDLICDGERIPRGGQPYDTSAFYQKHPAWSAMGKNAWDVMRSVDFLAGLPQVDTSRIACAGHSLGGHTSVFAAAFDSRIAAVVSNCGALDWQLPADHWSRKPCSSGAPVESYIYIPRFRAYIDNPGLVPPVDFHHLMMLIAPRPLLVMASEEEARSQRLREKVKKAEDALDALGSESQISSFTFPGGHRFPPEARSFAFSWLDAALQRT